MESKPEKNIIIVTHINRLKCLLKDMGIAYIDSYEIILFKINGTDINIYNVIPYNILFKKIKLSNYNNDNILNIYIITENVKIDHKETTMTIPLFDKNQIQEYKISDENSLYKYKYISKATLLEKMGKIGKELYNILTGKTIDYLFTSREESTINMLDSLLIELTDPEPKPTSVPITIINKEVIVLPCSHNVLYRDKGKCDDAIFERFKLTKIPCIDAKNKDAKNKDAQNKNTNIISNCINLTINKFDINWDLYLEFIKRKLKGFGPRKYLCNDTNINMLSLILSYIQPTLKNVATIEKADTQSTLEQVATPIDYETIITTAKIITYTIESQSIGGYYDKYLKYKYKYLELKNKNYQ